MKYQKALGDPATKSGGLLNNRDCSSFTQDYFSVFGKYLHRNSKALKIPINCDFKNQRVKNIKILYSTLLMYYLFYKNIKKFYYLY